MLYALALLVLTAADDAPTKTAKPEPAAAATPKSSGAEKKESGSKDPNAAESAAAPATDSVSAQKKDADKKEDDGEAKAKAAEANAAAAKFWEIVNSGALGYMIAGGIFMWPILILGILAAGVIIERYRTLNMLTTDSSAVRGQVRTLLEDDKVEDALKLCDREQGPVPAILSAGLRKYLVLRRLNYDAGRIEEQVVKEMDDYGVHVVAALERHLPILATVSSVAPMIGFLGTVQGMVVSFADIKDAAAGANIIKVAAAGIEIALLTTCLGLIVGIPAFMAYNYFTSVINRFVLDVEETSSELIESVTLQLTLSQQKVS